MDVPPDTFPPVEAETVVVWRASLDVPAARHVVLARILDDEERRRAGRFVRPLDGRRFEVGRGWLRTVLGGVLRRPPEAIVLDTGPRGKPRLAEPLAATGLRFNLAHSADRLLIALTRGREIGVDIERIRRLRRGPDLARRVFSDAELSRIAGLKGRAWDEAFFRGWTRKEAFVKAVGVGLAFSLRRVTVTLGADEPAELVDVEGDPTAADRWSLASVDAGPGFFGALAVESGPVAPRVVEIRLG